jgi:hypothetical protein
MGLVLCVHIIFICCTTQLCMWAQANRMLITSTLADKSKNSLWNIWYQIHSNMSDCREDITVYYSRFLSHLYVTMSVYLTIYVCVCIYIYTHTHTYTHRFRSQSKCHVHKQKHKQKWNIILKLYNYCKATRHCNRNVSTIFATRILWISHP